jgi:hypothetical protein
VRVFSGIATTVLDRANGTLDTADATNLLTSHLDGVLAGISGRVDELATDADAAFVAEMAGIDVAAVAYIGDLETVFRVLVSAAGRRLKRRSWIT